MRALHTKDPDLKSIQINGFIQLELTIRREVVELHIDFTL